MELKQRRNTCFTVDPASPLHRVIIETGNRSCPCGTATGHITNGQSHPRPPICHPHNHTPVIEQLLLVEVGLLEEGEEEVQGQDAVVDGVEEVQDCGMIVGKGSY